MSKVFKITRKEFGKEYASALKLITIPTDIQINQLKKLNVHNSPEYSVKYIHNIVKKVINEVEKKSKNNLMFLLILFFLIILIGITLLDVVKEFFE
jgi:hypothetical protein